MAKLLHKIQDALSQMSARERRLVIGGSVAMLITIIIGGGWGGWSHITGLEQDVSNREEALRQMQMMAMDHASNLEKAELIATSLEKNQNTTMQSFVEKKAAEVGIQRDRLDAIKGKTPITKGTLEETSFTVELSKLSLEDAMNFINVLEASDFPMVIRNTKFKTQKISGEKLIRLTLEIAAYQSLATSGGE
jgi:type II secretory pathway component PulM